MNQELVANPNLNKMNISYKIENQKHFDTNSNTQEEGNSNK